MGNERLQNICGAAIGVDAGSWQGQPWPKSVLTTVVSGAPSFGGTQSPFDNSPMDVARRTGAAKWQVESDLQAILCRADGVQRLHLAPSPDPAEQYEQAPGNFPR